MKTKIYVDGIRPRQTKKQDTEIALQLVQGIATVISIILALDAMCFIAWAMSGQQPIDGFYFGSITAHILSAIL